MKKEDLTGPAGTDEADLLLVAAVLVGDRPAFESLVRRHERRVFRVALAVLGNIEDAEEAMQEAFIKAYRHLDQFRRESRFTTWLTRIAVNEAVQKRNSRRDLAPLDQAESAQQQFIPKRYEPWNASPEQIYSKQEIHRLVEAAIQTLPAIYREAFMLRDLEDLSAKEAAAVLGIGVPALKSRLLRARLLLREILAEKFEQAPTWRSKVLHTTVDMGAAVALRLMRAAGL